MLTQRNSFQISSKIIPGIWHLTFWHNGSSVPKQSHIMMMVSCVYDDNDGAFVRNAEHYAKHSFLRNVQSITKRWFVYRWSSDEHQLLYSRQRVDDLPELDREITQNGISITNVMQIYKGYNPAAQSESGPLKDVNYFCWQLPLFSLGKLI